MRAETDRPGIATRGYSKPQCVARSASEIAHLLNEKLTAQPLSGNRAICAGERLAPVLFVQGYTGDARSIQEEARSQNLRGCLCQAADSSGLVGRLPQEWQDLGAEEPDFLVLDLGADEASACEVVRKIRNESRLCGVALVILARGVCDSGVSECCDVGGAWWMNRISEPAQVVRALRAVLRLWAEVLKLSPTRVRGTL